MYSSREPSAYFTPPVGSSNWGTERGYTAGRTDRQTEGKLSRTKPEDMLYATRTSQWKSGSRGRERRHIRSHPLNQSIIACLVYVYECKPFIGRVGFEVSFELILLQFQRKPTQWESRVGRKMTEQQLLVYQEYWYWSESPQAVNHHTPTNG